MTREEVYERLNAVFRDVFDDKELTVNDETTAADVDGWDSLIHITLIDAVEEEFDIRTDGFVCVAKALLRLLDSSIPMLLHPIRCSLMP